jgi:hypothetical protein
MREDSILFLRGLERHPLKELRDLDSRLHHTQIQLACQNLPVVARLLTNCGNYVLTRVKRIIDWGEGPDVDDTDLIAYSCRCIFEACLMLRHYGKRQAKDMYELMRDEMLRDDFEILKCSVNFLGSPTPETQEIFDEYATRKASLPTKTPPLQKLAEECGAKKEYEDFYRFYSKYAHPSAYYLFGDHRQVHVGSVRDFFLDRAVIYTGYCAEEMSRLLEKASVLNPNRRA